MKNFKELLGKAIEAIGDIGGDRAKLGISWVVVQKFARLGDPRPRRYSMAHGYPSWQSLTNRRYTGRHLREGPEYPADQSPTVPDLVNLFLRPKDGFVPSRNTSVLFMFFAQWFTDAFLRTDFYDYRLNDSNHEVDLCALYGQTEHDTEMLRCRVKRKGGWVHKPGHEHLLDTQEHAVGQLPPQLYKQDTQEPLAFRENYVESITTGDGTTVLRYLHDPAKMDSITKGQTPDQIRDYFAMGLEHGNGTIGYVVLNTLMLRAHNHIAEVIREKHCPGLAPAAWEPGWTPDRVFQAARCVLTVILLRIVVMDYIRHISGRKLVVPAGIADKARWGKPNHIAIEFNLLYRWHSMVPGTLFAPDGRELGPDEFRRNPKPVTDYGLGPLLTAFSRQKAGRMCLFNHPDFFNQRRDPQKPSTLERTLGSIMRPAKLQTMNSYRRQFGLPPYASFEALVGNQPNARELVSTLKRLYDNDIDRVEWFVGIFAEEHGKGKIMGDLMLRMVANDAFTQALTNPLLSRDVYKDDEVFSKTGREIMEGISSLQDLSDMVLGKDAAICSFEVVA